tara:strand:+ start:501 stop:1076 length:576 start_codon:yes stop_codon:yes gene_type:complete
MKKILIILILLFSFKIDVNAEIQRIVSGNKNAQITIIAYESLTCSHCADFHKDIYPQLKKEYLDTGLARIEFRHFPLDMAALNASKIAQCKNEQNLRILEKLYLNQKMWLEGNTIEQINENLKAFIKKEGFKINFEKCINDKEIEDYVLNDRIEGTKNYKINSTPTIIINEEKFEKTLNYKNLKNSLEKLI